MRLLEARVKKLEARPSYIQYVAPTFEPKHVAPKLEAKLASLRQFKLNTPSTVMFTETAGSTGVDLSMKPWTVRSINTQTHEEETT